LAETVGFVETNFTIQSVTEDPVTVKWTGKNQYHACSSVQ